MFGTKNLRREIVWNVAVLSGFKTAANNWIRGHDTLLYYARNADDVQFNRKRQPHEPEVPEPIQQG